MKPKKPRPDRVKNILDRSLYFNPLHLSLYMYFYPLATGQTKIYQPKYMVQTILNPSKVQDFPRRVAGCTMGGGITSATPVLLEHM